MILRRLVPNDEPAFRKAWKDFQDPVFHFAAGFDPSQPFSAYLAKLADRETSEKLPPDRVPDTFLCGFEGNEIVGRVSIRHSLNMSLEEVGGRVGFGVVPRLRGRGYGKEMLRLSLHVASSLGLSRILLTCDDANVPSAKSIEACGGVFERFCVDTGDGIKKRRYWIELR